MNVARVQETADLMPNPTSAPSARVPGRVTVLCGLPRVPGDAPPASCPQAPTSPSFHSPSALPTLLPVLLGPTFCPLASSLPV